MAGNRFSAVLQRSHGSVTDPVAAGDFHFDDGHALDLVLTDDFCELFAVVRAVKLGASYERHVSSHKFLVEAAAGIGGQSAAIRRWQPSK